MLGKPKLEFGCEIEGNKEHPVLLYVGHYDKFNEDKHCIKYPKTQALVFVDSDEIKVLGKPVKLEEVMRMIQQGGGASCEFLGGGNSTLCELYVDDGVSVSARIDLTKSPEEQDIEVQKKIIELINNLK